MCPSFLSLDFPGESALRFVSSAYFLLLLLFGLNVNIGIWIFGTKFVPKKSYFSGPGGSLWFLNFWYLTLFRCLAHTQAWFKDNFPRQIRIGLQFWKRFSTSLLANLPQKHSTKTAENTSCGADPAREFILRGDLPTAWWKSQPHVPFKPPIYALKPPPGQS